MAAFVAYYKSSKPAHPAQPVLAPGEPERAAMAVRSPGTPNQLIRQRVLYDRGNLTLSSGRGGLRRNVASSPETSLSYTSLGVFISRHAHFELAGGRGRSGSPRGSRSLFTPGTRWRPQPAGWGCPTPRPRRLCCTLCRRRTRRKMGRSKSSSRSRSRCEGQQQEQEGGSGAPRRSDWLCFRLFEQLAAVFVDALHCAHTSNLMAFYAYRVAHGYCCPLQQLRVLVLFTRLYNTGLLRKTLGPVFLEGLVTIAEFQ